MRRLLAGWIALWIVMTADGPAARAAPQPDTTAVPVAAVEEDYGSPLYRRTTSRLHVVAVLVAVGILTGATVVALSRRPPDR